jgi:hypothetical protein
MGNLGIWELSRKRSDEALKAGQLTLDFANVKGLML